MTNPSPDLPQPNQEQPPIREVGPRQGIMHFKDAPKIVEQGSEQIVSSGYIPFGAGLLSIDGTRGTSIKDKEDEFLADDIALTVDEQGRKVEANALELAKKGYFTVWTNFLTPIEQNVLRGSHIRLWIDGGDTLMTSEFKDPTYPTAQEITKEHPEIKDVPGIDRMFLYLNHLEDEATVGAKRVMLPRVMFTKIRANIEQAKAGEQR